MKYSAKQIIVLFNKSNSGKSYINVSDGVMSIIPTPVYEMCKSGEVDEVEMEPGQPLFDEVDKAKKVFDTMKVKTFSESPLAKLEKAKRFVDAYKGFDQAAFNQAMQAASAITF